MLRRNTTYHNWGEGLSTYNATNTLMERNTVYDNSKQVYISDTTGTTARRNLVYCTPGNPYRLSTTVTQHGINLQDEDQLPASVRHRHRQQPGRRVRDELQVVSLQHRRAR